MTGNDVTWQEVAGSEPEGRHLTGGHLEVAAEGL